MFGECGHIPTRIKRAMVVVQLERRSTLIIRLVGFPPDAFEYGVGGIIVETAIDHFVGEFDEQRPNLGVLPVELSRRILEFILAGFGFCVGE